LLYSNPFDCGEVTGDRGSWDRFRVEFLKYFGWARFRHDDRAVIVDEDASAKDGDESHDVDCDQMVLEISAMMRIFVGARTGTIVIGQRNNMSAVDGLSRKANPAITTWVTTIAVTNGHGVVVRRRVHR
jgi:hypothetical protein